MLIMFCYEYSTTVGIHLVQVLEWAEHHKEDPPPPEDDENKEKRTDDIEPWDQEFLRVDQGTLFELILVSGAYRETYVCTYQLTGLWASTYFKRELH